MQMAKSRYFDLSSKEGAQKLVDWAQTNGLFLNEALQKMVIKHGVSTEGVRITRTN